MSGAREASYNWVVAWRDAALADGWISKPTYSNESEDRASTLRKEGFVAIIITRTPKPTSYNKHPRHEGSVSV